MTEVAAARRIRRALNDLSDGLLKDIGMRRSDIDFIADALASRVERPAREASDRLGHAARPRRMAMYWPLRAAFHVTLVVVLAISTLVMLLSRTVLAQDTQTRRGKYLVALAGCNDCHTPGYFFGKPDMARFLAGSEVGFEVPDVGVFHGPNLTPDRNTGLGKWSTEEIVAALTRGQRPDGRILVPVMPWHAFANLTPQDARAIALFLKSLPPIENKVPGPFGPGEKPTSFVMKIVPPEDAATTGSPLK